MKSVAANAVTDRYTQTEYRNPAVHACRGLIINICKILRMSSQVAQLYRKPKAQDIVTEVSELA